jgi:O-antigen/teichoic acid export membrane protein
MADNLKKNMIGAIAWSSINIFGIQAIQLIIGIFLARLLMPADFGIIGVLMVFISLSTVLIDGGFVQGLIRKKDTTEQDLSTIFYLNIIVGIVLYTILYFCAPLIARFFAQPDLTKYSRVLFVIILIFPLYLIQLTQLLKNLEYKKIAIANITSVIVSGSFAIVLAFKGYGVWTLIYQQIAFHSVRVVSYFILVRWKPLLCFNFSTIRNLWSFTMPLLAQTSLNAIFGQIYFVVIGRLFPLNQVGYFTQANKYSETVNAATQNILSTGTFPVLSTIQDDKPRILRVYRKLITSVSTIFFPFVIFLIVAAQPIVVTLITEKWLPSVILLQLLLLANLLTPMFTININVLNAQGLSSASLRLELIKKGLITISIIACFSFGIEIMLIGFVVANFLAYLFSMVTIKKTLSHYYRHQIGDLMKILIISLIIGAITWMFNHLDISALLKLIIQGFTFFIIYIIVIRIIFPEKLREIIALKSKKE